MDTIFVLNTNRQVIDILSNNGSNPSAPFFGDTYTSELDTGAESYEFTTINNARTNITLEVGNYVLFKYNGKYKLFQIMETTDEHSEGKKLLTVYAEMAGMELRNDYCEPFTLEGNFINLLERVLQDTNWRVGTYSESLLYNIQSISYTEPKNVYSIIQENLATFGGVEIEFRVEFIGNQLAALLIDCYESGTRGNKKYRRFEYGKDVKGITRERNINDLATAVIGQGNNNITFKDIEWSKNLGNPCDKPLQQNFVVDIDANDLWNNGGKYIKTVHKVDTDDAQTLLQECWDYLQEIKQPKFDYDVDLALVAEDYQDIGVGDTNYVLDFDYQPAILLEARVGKLELSFADPRDNKCTLTNYKELVSILQQPVDLNTVGNMIQSHFPIEGEDIAMGAIGEGHINVTYYQAIKTDIMSATLAEVGTLIADKADITDLTALNADIENLRATKAEIEDLNATNGNITNLTSQVGQIDTIINNHFTGTDSQILNITAENTTIDNAVIKNAMIETVSADKVNTGTINTNNVVIESEDGGIKISGATQQFKDNTGTVRVQIGKDAQGNFTFCLFSQDGVGILLDETGIKTGAVPDGLIVNDMVADNANISGNKLDISSVITSINNNTTSIDSSHIKFDDTGQSLLVAFNSLKTKVETIENITIDGDLSSVMEQVQTNTTNIGIIQGQISSLITNTTITKQDGTVVQIKDDYSTTKQTVSELSTKIGSLETNYKKTLKTSSVQYYLSTSLTELAGGSWQDTAPSWAQGKYMWQRMKYTYTDGSTTYGTASCVAGAKGDTGKQGPQGIKGEQGIQGERGPQGNKGATGEKGQSLTSSTPQWYLSTSNTTQTGGSWQDTMPTVTTGKYMWQRWKNVWTNPAATTYTTPVLEQIAESIKEVTSKQAEYKQTLDEVKSTLTQTTTTANEAKTQASTNRQTIDSMSTTLTSTTKTANEAKTQSSSNKQTIDSMSTTLTSTTNTANNALNKATTAQQNLDGFKTTVSNTYTTKTDFNNLSIGGRNLIRAKDVKKHNASSATFDKKTNTWTIVAKAVGDGTTRCGLVLNATGENSICVPYGKTYVFSCEIKVPRNCTVTADINNGAKSGSNWSGNDNDTSRSSTTKSITTPNQWVKYWFKWSNTSSKNTNKVDLYDYSNFGVDVRNETSDMTYYVRNIQGEIGNVPTEWRPAPEDIDDKFTNYSTTTQMNSAITQKANEITSSVSSTYVSKTDATNTYATKSLVTQTANDVRFEFRHQSTANLIPNGNGGGMNHDSWYAWQSWWYEWHSPGSPGFVVSDYNSGCIGVTRIAVNPNTTYSLKLHICPESNTGNYWISAKVFRSDGTSYYQDIVRANSTKGWHTVRASFTTQSDASSINIEIFSDKRKSTEGAYVTWYSEVMLFEGDQYFPNKYVPNGDTIHSNYTTINTDGVTVYMENGSSSAGRANLNFDGLTVYNGNGVKSAWFGNNDTAFIDRISTNRIDEPSLLRKDTGGCYHLYCAPNATGDGTGRDQNNRASSIYNALEWFRNTYGTFLWKKDLYVHLASGDYWGADNYIGGWLGTGSIKIEFDQWACLRTPVKIEDNTVTVYLTGIVNAWDWNTQNNAYIYLGNTNGIIIRRSTVIIGGLNIQKEGWGGDVNTWNNYEATCICAEKGSHVFVKCCDIVGFWNCVYVQDVSILCIDDCRGHCHTMGDLSSGAILIENLSSPLFLDNTYLHDGGQVMGSFDKRSNSFFAPKPDAPYTPPPAPTENWQATENTWNASSLWTTPEGSGSGTTARSGCWGQGNWSSYKAHRGHASFDGVNAWCNGGRNFTAYITMRRLDTKHGNYGAVPVPKFVKTDGNSWSCGQAFALGDWKTIQLPWEVVASLIQGGTNELQLWAGKNTSDYSFYDNVSLRITCEKNFI